MAALDRRFGTHFRATCANCKADTEVCSRRLDGEGALNMAIDKLRKAGWHVDGRGTDRERWYCPACSSKPHL
jgi:hypothetical protein